jgi:hypothetical protein
MSGIVSASVCCGVLLAMPSATSPHPTATAAARQKDVFGAVDSYAWRRIASWLARKHSRLSRQQMHRRFCQPGTWKIAHDGIAFTGASSVVVTRYRYRGHHIPSPWTPVPAALTG